MKRMVKCVSRFSDDADLTQFSDELSKKFPYMISYTVDNSTWGDDFQRRAESLGCIKVEGRYKGKYQPSIFYLAPSMEIYDEVKKFNIPTIRLGGIYRYPGSEDYLLTRIFTSCPEQKELNKLMRARI